MTALLIVLAILLLPILITTLALLASGVGLIVKYSTLIVCGLIVFLIIRIIRRRK